MVCCFAFFTLFHLSLTFFRPEVPFKGLFRSRAASFFEADLTPIGVLPSICKALNKYDLFHYFQSWFLDSSFPSYSN